MSLRAFLASMLLIWCTGALAFAQGEATLTGTVTDQSKAAVAGATVTATDKSTGRQFTGMSDANGDFRIVNIQAGTYIVEVQAGGFAPTAVNVELLVGQSATLPFTLRVASASATVEVTAETPLLNTQTQEIGGNIDRRQMDELPLLGRNWLDLSMMVKGVTANDVSGNRPGAARDDQFQLNLDGQQVSQGLATAGSFGEPHFSRDAISEYRLDTNLFDITEGRSTQTQVQAVTRSGSNDVHGTAYGNFRRDTFDAADPVAHYVLPFSDTQLGGTVGGPIIKDKLQYFAAYEWENSPDTVLLTPAIYAPASFPVAGDDRNWSVIGRGDYTVSPRDHLSVRTSFWDYLNPDTGQTTTSYPTASVAVHRYSRSTFGNWTRVLTPNLVQEVKAGYYSYFWKTDLASGVPSTPSYSFSAAGLSVGATSFYPESFWENSPSLRYDLSWHKGHHDIKFGAEVLFRTDNGYWPSNQRGTVTINATLAQIAAAGDGETLAQRFPLADWNKPSAWDFSGLDQYVTTITQNYSNNWSIKTPRKEYGIWLGDTWHPFKSWTVTAGLRWDADWGEYAPGELIPSTVLINNGHDTPSLNVGVHTGVRSLDNFAPRGGISYAAPHGWVLRLGAGVFYGTQESNLAWGLQRSPPFQVSNTFVNTTSSPTFLSTYTGGNTPADYLNGTAPLTAQSYSTIAPDYRDPRTVQVSGGFQKQITSTLVVDSDLTYSKGNFLSNNRNINLLYDPLTGYPYNPNPAAAFAPANGITRPLMNYQTITIYESNLHSDYLALASSVTKRFANRWQSGLTYTLDIRADDEGTNSFGYIANTNNPFCVPCEWGRSTFFQRGTLRWNTIYQGPWGLTMSGIFYYGSGNYYDPGYSTPSQVTSIVGGFFDTNRLVPNILESPTAAPSSPVIIPAALAGRWDGPTTIYPGQTLKRDALEGTPLYKVDLRLQKDFTVFERVHLIPMVEVFNLFNHSNFGAFQSTVNLPDFGSPQQNSADSYVPREFQFAFRAVF